MVPPSGCILVLGLGTEMESAQDISFRKRHFSELSQTSSTTLSPASQRVHKYSKMDSLEDMHLDL